MKAETWYKNYVRRYGESEDFVRANEKDLRRQYGGRYIVVLDAKVIMSNFDLNNLLRLSLSKRYKTEPVLVGKIEEIVNPPILIFSTS